ncbi:MAG: TetR/AcrR family transcriptional regulator [Candidatus Nanopelagicales bacterium]
MPDSSSDDLIDASEVAEILGLSHRNSVSTYRHRYPDFPTGRRMPSGGRRLLWSRSEVVAWHRRFGVHRSKDLENPEARLRSLVDATTRLLLARPGAEVSVRQIAREAGIAHSDLYRHAESKEQLLALAVADINAEYLATLPRSFDALMANLEENLVGVIQRRSALRVMADEMIRNPDAEPIGPIPVAHVAEAIAEHRRANGITSSVDPLVVAACIGALAWGITLFGERWRAGLGIEKIPIDQVAAVMRRMLTA